MASAIYQKRAFPIFWMILAKKGASNLREQQIILRPVIKLFKTYKIVIVGDREFHSVELAQWIRQQGVKFVLRQKKDTKYRHNWIVAFHECHEWVQELIDCLSNKRTFYQRGLRAITLIQQAL